MSIIDNFLQDKYQKKRAIIVSFFLFLFIIIIFFLYFLLKPDPTCIDGKKNQNEQGIDCGGVCPEKCDKPILIDLEVLEKGFLNSGVENKVDIFGKIKNPNNTFGGGRFKYEFILRDTQGIVVGTKTNESFILPGETKYIVENNILVQNGEVAGIELKVTDTQWVEFNDYYQRPQLKIVNKRYGEIVSGVGFSEAMGLLKNESHFDFALIKLAIILRDANNNVLAINSTEMRTVRVGENRDFKALWFSRFPGEVLNIEVQADADVFNPETFIDGDFSSEYLQKPDYR